MDGTAMEVRLLEETVSNVKIENESPAKERNDFSLIEILSEKITQFLYL